MGGGWDATAQENQISHVLYSSPRGAAGQAQLPQGLPLRARHTRLPFEWGGGSGGGPGMCELSLDAGVTAGCWGEGSEGYAEGRAEGRARAGRRVGRGLGTGQVKVEARIGCVAHLRWCDQQRREWRGRAERETGGPI